jgi:hypothetical protein
MHRTRDKVSIFCAELGIGEESISIDTVRPSDTKDEREDTNKPDNLSHSRNINISRLRESGSDSEVSPRVAHAFDRKDAAAKDPDTSPVKKRPLTRAMAIKRHCHDCGGESPKEVTLCHIVDCLLWPYRFGHTIKDKRFKERMQRAMVNYPEEFAEVQEAVSECLVNMANSPENEQIRALFEDIKGGVGE